jgi:ATP-dependent Clp protease ATP-binding subunit ClpC
MFERFTDRARRVVVFAQEEARMLNHSYIGTEHILLGLIHEGEGVAARALESLGISLPDVRRDVGEIIGKGEGAPTGHIPFTPRAKKILELSLREALQLGHSYIGTEHILLGLVREGEGVAAQVLQKRGADLNRVRQTVIQLLSGYAGGEATATGETVSGVGTFGEPATGDEVSDVHDQPTCSSCFAILQDHARIRRLEIDDVGGSRSVEVLYCGRCGVTLGVVGS